MNALVPAVKTAEWHKLKALVLDSVSSPITRRMYNLALDEFIQWYTMEPRPGFTKATASAWRAALEARGLGSVSIKFESRLFGNWLSRRPTTGCSLPSWRPGSAARRA